MGRGLVERAGLGPRASLSAAVARTGPQAGASWRRDRHTKKLRRNCRRPLEEKLSQQVRILGIKSGAAARARRRVRTALGNGYLRTSNAPGDGETSQHAERGAPSASKENATPQSSPQRRAGEKNVPIVFITPSEGPRAVQSRLASDGTLASIYICTTVRIRGRRHRRLE